MGNARIHRSKVVELMFVGPGRFSACEVIGNVGQMKQDGHRVNKKLCVYHWRSSGISQQVRGDDTTVGMRDEDELGPPVALNDLQDLVRHLFAAQCRKRKPEANWHDLDGDDSHLSIHWFLLKTVELGQKRGICPKSDPDPVNKQDWKPRLRRVWAVPVGKRLGWGRIAGQQRQRTWREDREETAQCQSVEVKRIISHVDVGQCIDPENDLGEYCQLPLHVAHLDFKPQVDSPDTKSKV